MRPDLRFLIALNFSLIVVAILATAKLLALTPPKSDFTANIEKINASSSVGQAAEAAVMIAKVAMRRGEKIKEERRLAAILGGFVGFVGVTNLIFLVHLYRQVKNGVYFQDGVELEKI
jgi:hypothetical protein